MRICLVHFSTHSEITSKKVKKENTWSKTTKRKRTLQIPKKKTKGIILYILITYENLEKWTWELMVILRYIKLSCYFVVINFTLVLHFGKSAGCLFRLLLNYIKTLIRITFHSQLLHIVCRTFSNIEMLYIFAV